MDPLEAARQRLDLESFATLPAVDSAGQVLDMLKRIANGFANCTSAAASIHPLARPIEDCSRHWGSSVPSALSKLGHYLRRLKKSCAWWVTEKLVGDGMEKGHHLPHRDLNLPAYLSFQHQGRLSRRPMLLSRAL